MQLTHPGGVTGDVKADVPEVVKAVLVDVRADVRALAMQVVLALVRQHVLLTVEVLATSDNKCLDEYSCRTYYWFI